MRKVNQSREKTIFLPCLPLSHFLYYKTLGYRWSVGLNPRTWIGFLPSGLGRNMSLGWRSHSRIICKAYSSRPSLESTLFVPSVNLMPAFFAWRMKSALGSFSRLLISITTPLRAAASITRVTRSGVQSASYSLIDNVGQVGRIGVDVDRLVIENPLDGPHEQFHEGLLVGNIDLLGNPQPGSLAAVVHNGHGIGKDVVELCDGFLGEQGRPLAALGLHADEARLASILAI